MDIPAASSTKSALFVDVREQHQQQPTKLCQKPRMINERQQQQQRGRINNSTGQTDVIVEPEMSKKCKLYASV